MPQSPIEKLMVVLNPIILIPAPMHAPRLPGKPLADIHGEPMIVHVWRRAMQAGIGPVVVACSEAEGLRLTGRSRALLVSARGSAAERARTAPS